MIWLLFCPRCHESNLSKLFVNKRFSFNNFKPGLSSSKKRFLNSNKIRHLPLLPFVETKMSFLSHRKNPVKRKVIRELFASRRRRLKRTPRQSFLPVVLTQGRWFLARRSLADRCKARCRLSRFRAQRLVRKVRLQGNPRHAFQPGCDRGQRGNDVA